MIEVHMGIDKNNTLPETAERRRRAEETLRAKMTELRLPHYRVRRD